MVRRLISVGWGNVSRVLELEEKDGKYIGTSFEYFHTSNAHVVSVLSIGDSGEFASIERAKDSLSFYTDNGPVFTEEEQIAGCNKLFHEGTDVVELSSGAAINCSIAYRPKGFDVVWRGEKQNRNILTERVVIIRIPEDGQVRCPKRLMGRVIGKKGVKVNELSKKHGVKIHLVEIPD
jgi:hypothetical protein